MSGLEIRALGFGRRGFTGGPLTLDAPRGARVALLGPNGGGKTTLLKTVAGLLRPLAGQVRVEGRDLTSERASQRAGLVAYLPPPGEVESPLSARHMVALGRIARRSWPADLTAEDRDTAEAALLDLGLESLASRPFDELSSGERQLVLLARTLVQDARVCVLDEPSATLDPAHRSAVARAVERLAGTGAVIVLSTHDPAEAAEADLCILLGAEIVIGPPASALTASRLSALYGVDLIPCGECGKPR